MTTQPTRVMIGLPTHYPPPRENQQSRRCRQRGRRRWPCSAALARYQSAKSAAKLNVGALQRSTTTSAAARLRSRPRPKADADATGTSEPGCPFEARTSPLGAPTAAHEAATLRLRGPFMHLWGLTSMLGGWRAHSIGLTSALGTQAAHPTGV